MNVTMKQSDFEAVGEAFSLKQMFEQRDRTREVIGAIAAAVKPGMVEEDAVDMAKGMLAERKMLRGWHDVYVRFGTNTTKTFGEASDPGIVLGDTDIFLIDIGPVFEKWEGDGGDTFVFGDDPEMARAAVDARAIFHAARKLWLKDGLSGQALYAFAVEEAEKLGWALNMDLSGHRLSDFPHSVIYDGPMADMTFTPSPALWVLEIHIRHPTRPFGAFFEDMLLDDSYFPA
ncbi:MAG TPA: M24 family metallopeptidase [Caulobacteraceae bacterium]|nr:M24 family metallopeptidase [Caulobacteraceae bacterium]